MSTESTQLPAQKIEFNPFLPEFIDDPRPALRRLREHDPVHWSPAIGVWVLTRYADVLAAQRDERFSASSKNWDRYRQFFFRAGMTQESPLARAYDKWMLQLDPPDHTRLRALVNKAFTPRVVERMAPRITAIVDEMIDAVIDRGQMDLIGDLAYPFPIKVIGELLGVPPEDHDRIKQWCAGLLPSFTPALSLRAANDIARVLGEFREFFSDLCKQKREHRTDDLLSALIDAREKGDRLSEDELLSTAILLAFAGHATTVQLIGSAMQFLLQNPLELARLKREPTLIHSAIEETLRYSSPLQLIYRTTKSPIQIGSKQIPSGQMVFLSIIGANFDPAQFPDPDRFDIGRSPNRHIAFGYGAHYCVGAPLGRMAAQIVIQRIVQRLADLELAGPIKREGSLLLRGITSMPLRFSSKYTMKVAAA